MNIAKRLKVSAEILLVITVIIMIIVAIKVISLGDPIRLQLLLSTIFFVLFMWLGWIQPKVTGIGLICLGQAGNFTKRYKINMISPKLKDSATDYHGFRKK